MARRHAWAFALVGLLALMALTAAGALAQSSWTDLTDDILNDYGVTADEVAQISEGYTDGTWRPYAEMTRAQFVKMAVEAFDLPMVTPATATFVDVPVDHQFFVYVESAYAAGLIEGTGSDSSGRYFGPGTSVTRQQGAAIIVRYQADQDGINLETEYGPTEIASLLGPFNDDAAVSEALRAETAAAVDWGILKGTTDNYLRPANPLLRIQGAAMLIRSMPDMPPSTTTTTVPNGTTTTTSVVPPTTSSTVQPPNGGTLNRTATGLVFTDDFTGVDGAPWNSAKWDDATAGSTALTEILGNRGHMEFAAFYERTGGFAKMPAQTDSELTMEFEVSTGNRGYLVPWMRGDGDVAAADDYGYLNGYIIEFGSDHLTLDPPLPIPIYRRVAGDFGPSNQLAVSARDYTPGLGTPWRLRFRVEGTDLMARYWEAADPEPTTWNVSATDSNFSSGDFALLFAIQNEGAADFVEAYVDDVQVRTGHTITVTGLPAGYEVRVNNDDSLRETASGGTAVVDVGSVWQDVTSIQVLNGSTVVASLGTGDYSDMGGGDVFGFTAN